MGPNVLEFIPSFLANGLLPSDSPKELCDFITFIGFIIHKFSHSVTAMLMELWRPLVIKVDQYLSQPPIGTDDVINLQALRKSLLSILTTLFNEELDKVLVAEHNLPELNRTLTAVLACLDELSDMPTRKLVFSLLSKMATCWAGDGQVHFVIPDLARPTKKATNKPVKKEPVIVKNPLPGFDAFFEEHILPLAFIIPTSPSFPLSDGAAAVVVGEIAGMHQAALSSLGEKYLQIILTKYLNSLPCAEQTKMEFLNEMQKDKKSFRQYLLVQEINLEILSRRENAIVDCKCHSSTLEYAIVD